MIKEYIIVAIKGFVIGIANIIPGVSGGTLAFILGIYEKLLNILKAFWKNFYENLKFVIPFGIGIVLAILLGSKAISFSLDHFPIATALVFAGMVIGGIPFIFKKIKFEYSAVNFMIFLLIITIVISLTLNFSKNDNPLINVTLLDTLILFGVGFIASFTMIIPGISGSMVLMMMGYYETLIDTLNDLTNLNHLWHNLSILIPFGLGVIVGIIMASYLISYLLKKWPYKTYYAIFGFILASVFNILYEAFKNPINIYELIIGILLALLGGITTYLISKKDEVTQT